MLRNFKVNIWSEIHASRYVSTCEGRPVIEIYSCITMYRSTNVRIRCVKFNKKIIYSKYPRKQREMSNLSEHV